MNNELLLLSGNDIPFLEAQATIHQPKIKEIAYIGEESFFSGCQFLNFSKNIFNEQDKLDLSEQTDFDIFMSIMCSNEKIGYKQDAENVLTLLFPNHMCKCTQHDLLLIKDNSVVRINNTNFDVFKDILTSMFDLNDGSISGKAYNPADKRAAKIAEKLQKAKNRKNGGNEPVKKISVFGRYISILSVGLQKDMNSLLQYTVFQLKDEFKRYQMKQSFDINLQAKMAGATGLEEVDNWMDDIHP